MKRLALLAVILLACCTAGAARASWSDWGFASYDDCMGATNDWADCNDGSQPDPNAPADPPPVYGCTNSLAVNFNGAATVDDGSCQLPESVTEPAPPNCVASRLGLSFTQSPNIVTGAVTLTCEGSPPFTGVLTLKLLRADTYMGEMVQIAAEEVEIDDTNPTVAVVYPCNINPFPAWFTVEADWSIGDVTGAGSPGTNRLGSGLRVDPVSNGGCL